KEDSRQMNKLEEVVVVVPEKNKRQDKDHSENKGKRAKLNHNSVAKALKTHEKVVVEKQELVFSKESVLGGPSTENGKMQVKIHQDTVVVKSTHVLEVLAELEVSKENGRSINSQSAEHQ
ncbi:13765_t:CDS:1, partial [Dentiscutata heterogama]